MKKQKFGCNICTIKTNLSDNFLGDEIALKKISCMEPFNFYYIEFVKAKQFKILFCQNNVSRSRKKHK